VIAHDLSYFADRRTKAISSMAASGTLADLSECPIMRREAVLTSSRLDGPIRAHMAQNFEAIYVSLPGFRCRQQPVVVNGGDHR
jgi:hypothetical protein